jgi:polysaccharide chain length determinant protein (PEP-CTERM system associated)
MKDLIRFISNEIRGTWRYRWTAMTIIWAVCLLGWLVVYTIPNVYQAQTRVYVDARSRLANVMAEVGASSGEGSTVFMVRQALLAREQLEKVIRAAGLDERAETEEDMERLLLVLSGQIGVSTGRSSQSRNLYTISFAHTDEEKAVTVVQTLLDIFIQDILELKEEGGEVVATYLDEQLTHYSNLLSESEMKLADFKKRYVGLLPGESGGIFERLQEQMNIRDELATQLRIENDRRNELRRQLGSETPNLPADSTATAGVTVPVNATDASIVDLEKRKGDLLLVYTERHPDVVAIEEQLEQLYAQRLANNAALAASGQGMEGVANATNPVYQSVQIALNESGVLVAQLRSQINQVNRQISELESQVNTIPEVEAEFAQLTRDYAQYQELYNELLVQKERARLGTAGAEQDVVNVNILEPPATGPKPIAPKRTLLLIVVLVLGLGAGIGTAFIKHQLNPVFIDAESLSRITGRPVLGVVSLTFLERFRVARAFEKSSFTLSGVGLLVVFVLAVALQDIGVEMFRTLSELSKS